MCVYILTDMAQRFCLRVLLFSFAVLFLDRRAHVYVAVVYYKVAITNVFIRTSFICHVYLKILFPITSRKTSAMFVPVCVYVCLCLCLCLYTNPVLPKSRTSYLVYFN